MMSPPPCRRITGSTASVQYATPLRLACTTRSQSAGFDVAQEALRHVHARARDDDVDAAVRGEDACPRRAAPRPCRRRRRRSACSAAGRFDALRGLGERVGAAARHRRRSAPASASATRARLADAASAAGDPRDLAAQRPHDDSPDDSRRSARGPIRPAARGRSSAARSDARRWRRDGTRAARPRPCRAIAASPAYGRADRTRCCAGSRRSPRGGP